jgi:nucleoside-diphosphate-sugar epimerase
LQFGEIPSYWQEMEHDPVSIHRLEQLTAWKPRIGIAEGIIRTVNFRRDMVNAGEYNVE